MAVKTPTPITAPKAPAPAPITGARPPRRPPALVRVPAGPISINTIREAKGFPPVAGGDAPASQADQQAFRDRPPGEQRAVRVRQETRRQIEEREKERQLERRKERKVSIKREDILKRLGRFKGDGGFNIVEALASKAVNPTELRILGFARAQVQQAERQGNKLRQERTIASALILGDITRRNEQAKALTALKGNTKDGRVDLAGALRRRIPEAIILKAGFSQGDINQARTRNRALKDLTKFRKGDRVNLSAAIRGGANDQSLRDAGFNTKSIRDAKVSNIVLDRLQSFKVPGGGFDLGAAINSGLSQDLIRRAGFSQADVTFAKTMNEIRKLQTKVPAGLQIAADVATAFVPGVWAKDWNRMSNLDRALNIGLDALLLVPLAGVAARGAVGTFKAGLRAAGASSKTSGRIARNLTNGLRRGDQGQVSRAVREIKGIRPRNTPVLSSRLNAIGRPNRSLAKLPETQLRPGGRATINSISRNYTGLTRTIRSKTLLQKVKGLRGKPRAKNLNILPSEVQRKTTAVAMAAFFGQKKVLESFARFARRVEGEGRVGRGRITTKTVKPKDPRILTRTRQATRAERTAAATRKAKAAVEAKPAVAGRVVRAKVAARTAKRFPRRLKLKKPTRRPVRPKRITGKPRGRPRFRGRRLIVLGLAGKALRRAAKAPVPSPTASPSQRGLRQDSPAKPIPTPLSRELQRITEAAKPFQRPAVRVSTRPTPTPVPKLEPFRETTPQPEPTPDAIPTETIGKGAPTRLATTSGGRPSAPPTAFKVKLPDGSEHTVKATKKGRFPRSIRFVLGLFRHTIDLDTGKRSVRLAPKKDVGKTPSQTFRVVQVDNTPPPNRTFQQGFIGITVTARDLTFEKKKTLRRSRRGKGF